jgi:hypothetical protein
MSAHDRYCSKKAHKIAKDPTKHYPNKNEAELLRKIKAETGLSEEEIRSIKTYRKMLSEAQKQGQKAKRTDTEKYYQKLIKEACKETKLAREHPLTLWVLEELIKAKRNYPYSRPWFLWSSDNPTAKQVVERYGKKKINQ